MSANLTTLFTETERRAKQMPTLLQQAINDAVALQGHLDQCSAAANQVTSNLQSLQSQMQGRFQALDSQVDTTQKRLSGRMTQASDALTEAASEGERQRREMASERKQTETAVNKLHKQTGGLNKQLKAAVESQQTATNTGLGLVEKAQGRLAAARTETSKQLAAVDKAVDSSGKSASGALNRLLASIGKAAETLERCRQNLHTAAAKQTGKLDARIKSLHSDTVAKRTVARTSKYSESVRTLKGSATKSTYRLQSVTENHDTVAQQAQNTFVAGYRAHESFSNGQASSARNQLERADGKLMKAWKELGLDANGNKDTRGFLQKTLDFPGYAWGKTVEFGTWAIQGVSGFVGKYHKEILLGLAAAAIVVGAVLLAPVVGPVLMAGAAALTSTIGGGITAGLGMAGSALAGVGSGLAGLGSMASAGLGTAGTGIMTFITGSNGAAASVGLLGPLAPAAAPAWSLPGMASAAVSWGGAALATPLGKGVGLAAAGLSLDYLHQGLTSGDWTPKLDKVIVGVGLKDDGSVQGQLGVNGRTVEAELGKVPLPGNAPPPQEPESGEAGAGSGDEGGYAEVTIGPDGKPMVAGGVSDADPLYDADAGGGQLGVTEPKPYPEQVLEEAKSGLVFEMEGKMWAIDENGQVRLLPDEGATGGPLQEGDQIAVQAAGVSEPMLGAVRNVLSDTHRALDSMGDAELKLKRLLTVYDPNRPGVRITPQQRQLYNQARTYMNELQGLKGRIGGLQNRAAHALQQFATRTVVRHGVATTGFVSGPGGMVTEGIATVWSITDGVAVGATLAGEATIEIPLLYTQTLNLVRVVAAL